MMDLNIFLTFFNIVLFDNKINAHLGLLILDLALILLFIISWYNNYVKTGWKIDYWQISILKGFILPLLIMYPFSASIYNIEAVGRKNFDGVASHMDKAFIIGLIGYACVYLGSEFYLKSNSKTYLDKIFSPVNLFIENNIKSPISLLTATFVSIALMLFVLYIQIANNLLFNPRQYFMANGFVRPLYNITLFVYPITLTYFGLRLIHKFNWNYLFLFAILLSLSVFLGTRGAILEPIVTFILFYYFKYHYRIKLKRIFFFGIGIIFLAFIFQIFRNNLSLSGEFAAQFLGDFFYGNSFSDYRDFSWILAFWDQKLLWGKTYLAGIIAFIPRQISEFRGEWNFGIFTTRVAQLDPTVHPGLRPGIFGEAFFNFGYVGVVFLGFLIGCITRHIDYSIKEIVTNTRDIIKAYSQTFAASVFICFGISVSFMNLYTFLVFTFALVWLRQSFRQNNSTPDYDI